MRRIIPKRDMGEAISIEDVLSLMTVVFVLFILFFVPLVNIDRMQLENARKDEYWQQLAEWLVEHGKPASSFYDEAFMLDGHRFYSADLPRGIRWVEALHSNGTITVVEHDLKRKAYTAMIVKGHSSVVTYRFGAIRWSAAERVFFTSADSLDYGDRPQSLEMKKRFRNYSEQTKGF